ncbi:MAG TPA: hypothetical protein VGC09_00425 [Rhodopila sp.]
MNESRVTVDGNEVGIALRSPAGQIMVAWADVPAMLENIRKTMARRGVDAHLARHAGLTNIAVDRP